uniref:hypothetical protein n=1 Tax=Escherichia coli TaxID=562 RepID=UPI001CBD656F
RGCNPTSSKFIHTWLRFGEIMRGSLRAERHQGNDMKILIARKAVYQLAREQHPERWSKHLRKLDYISEVYLNPEKEAA